jgi:hydrogenase nickel insertion protein HypA
MHEFGVVQELVERILEQTHGTKASRVTEIRLRRGSTFKEEPLRQAFTMLSQGTPLEGAVLTVEEYRVEVRCSRCGRIRGIAADDLIGHLFICPDCGQSQEIDEAHGLELIGVATA